MNQPVLTDDQRRILAFLHRHYPVEHYPAVFETRIVICGELRLALHEYDEACRELTRLRLLVTDPPQANDCDSVNLSAAGRRILTRPPQPGSLAWRILAHVCQTENGFTPATDIQTALGLSEGKADRGAFGGACQQLYDWGLLARREEGSQVYAFLMPTPAGWQAVESAGQN